MVLYALALSMRIAALTKKTEQVTISSDSPWFVGHFPNNPILPGVAQLRLVIELLERAGGGQIRLAALSRVKFRRIVRPGEVLDISVSPSEDKNHHSFTITCGDTAVCSGKLVFTHNRTRYDDMSDKITQTITRISEIIINELKLEDVTADTFNPDLDLVDEVGVDSMDLATVALVLRDEFGIRIDEDDYPKLSTVRIIANYILDKQNSRE